MKYFDSYIQSFLFLSLVVFMFCLFFFSIPAANLEILKMCLTAIISFLSGSSLAYAMLRTREDEEKKDTKGK